MDREAAQREIKKLKEETLAAKQRVEMIKSKDPTAKTSKEVDNALKELKNTFNQLKKNDPKNNFSKLNQHAETSKR